MEEALFLTATFVVGLFAGYAIREYHDINRGRFV
jgi:hypothetical protein